MYYQLLYKSKRGFSLIELLVAISIIALLAALIISGIGNSRTRGRDSKRVSDIKNIQISLELYYDRNHFYPDSATAQSVQTALTGLVSGGFMQSIPDDPLGGTVHYMYMSNGATKSTSYCLGADLESTIYAENTCATSPDLGATYEYRAGPQSL